MNNKFPNGGFPPIQYCVTKSKKNIKKNNKKKVKKEAFEFAPTLNSSSNINIREILSKNESIISNDQNKYEIIDDLIVIDEL